MNQLSQETENSILTIVNTIFLDTTTVASEITLYNSLNAPNSLPRELFSQNIEEYLFFTVTKRLITSFSDGQAQFVLKVSELLIQAQGGSILDAPEPSTLKFKLLDGKEHLIDSLTFEESSESDYWKLVAGYPEAKNDIYRIIEGSANHFSLSTLINTTRDKLLREWRMSE